MKVKFLQHNNSCTIPYFCFSYCVGAHCLTFPINIYLPYYLARARVKKWLGSSLQFFYL
jgi:hypothetical protein